MLMTPGKIFIIKVGSGIKQVAGGRRWGRKGTKKGSVKLKTFMALLDKMTTPSLRITSIRGKAVCWKRVK